MSQNNNPRSPNDEKLEQISPSENGQIEMVAYTSIIPDFLKTWWRKQLVTPLWTEIINKMNENPAEMLYYLKAFQFNGLSLETTVSTISDRPIHKLTFKINFSPACRESLGTLLKFLREKDNVEVCIDTTSQDALNWDRYKNDFEDICELGMGGFGRVRKAKNKLDEKEYAIKEIPLWKLTDSKINTLLEEVKLFSDLSHPNVTKYFSSWRQNVNSEPLKEIIEDYLISVNTSADGGSSTTHSPGEENDSLDIEFKTEESSDILYTERSSEDETSSSYGEVSFQTPSEDTNSLTPNRNENIRDSIPEVVEVLFIQMELGKESLSDWIKDRNERISKKKFVLNEELSVHVRIFKEILLALEYIHSKGIIHRDVKPQNILLSSDGRVLLADFGLAKENMKNGKLVAVSSDVGTREYTAPEVSTQKPYNTKVDIYSCGIILLEMMISFPTDMEKCKALEKLKKERKVDGFSKIKFKCPYEILLLMTEKNPVLRPTATEILCLIDKAKCLIPTVKDGSNSSSGIRDIFKGCNVCYKVAPNKQSKYEFPKLPNLDKVKKFRFKLKPLGLLRKLYASYAQKTRRLVRKGFEHLAKSSQEKEEKIKMMESKVVDLEMRIQNLEKQ